MSNSDQKMWIIENLPSGGAKVMYISNIKFLTKLFNINTIHEPKELNDRNFLIYLIKIYFMSNEWENDISQNIEKNDICVFYQSKYTKSPNLMSYLATNKIIYICQEGLREYFDSDHVTTQSIKEKFINLLRWPLIVNDKNNVNHAKIIVANSVFSKNNLLKQYKQPIQVIYPGIDLNKYKLKINRKFNIKKNGINILTVGTINKLKGQEFVLNVAKLLSTNTNVNVTFVGNGVDSYYLNKLRNIAARCENLTLKILNNISEEEKLNEYKNANLFIYAPISEPFGIVVLEAMATGLPIVAFKNGGGYAEILTNNNGLLINSRNPEMWKTKIEALCSDSNRLEEISKNNIKYSHYFDEKIMNNNLLKLIRNL